MRRASYVKNSPWWRRNTRICIPNPRTRRSFCKNLGSRRNRLDNYHCEVMRIVFVDTTLTTPPLGGAHTCLVELCTSLAGLDHQVTVVTQPGREQSAVRRLAEGKVDVRFD